MANLNRVMLMGNLTRDPELRHLPSNMAVTKVGLAVNRTWRNQQGEQQEETTYVDCEAFGRQAEVINQYLQKGKPIFIEGRLRLDQWQDKDGNNRSKMKVIIERFQFIDSRGGGEGGGGEGGGGQRGQGNQGGYGGQSGGGYEDQGDQAPPQRQQQQQYAPPRGAPPMGDPHEPVQEDDIPF